MHSEIKKKGEQVIDSIFNMVLGICLVALFFMVCVVSAQVVIRFLHGNIPWCEEVMLILMDLLLFLLLPVGIKEDLHISVEVFAKRFPRRVRKGLIYFSNTILLLVSICMIVYGKKLTAVSSIFPQTGLPRKYLYYVTIVSGVLCTITIIAKFFGLFITDTQREFLDWDSRAQGTETGVPQ